ncbi:class I SAM-dependent methyltransferase [Brevundimonas vesicularis]|uniref:class I SAM-dependent methyltransferase n=1 Tax=Brevundimonas vesicularis TaxID=41276 RepID=UPI0038D3D1DD
MSQPNAHTMLARQSPDEMAQQRFVLAVKRHVMGKLRPDIGTVYELEAEPKWRAEHGQSPKDRFEAEAALNATSHYRFTKALDRAAQEMMWQTIGETVYRERPRLEALSQILTTGPDRLGSLTLNPDFRIDPVYRDCHIHLQPEGYCPPDNGKSVTAGAFYESGGRLYSMGRGIGKEDSKAGAVIAWLETLRPGWKPKRILDMGCSAGGASTVYAKAFPEAEIHAIDLGESMLRYAHARAEALKVPVHFRQASATETGYATGSFDLVVSHNILHEMSGDARRGMAVESLRLLTPDGLCIHQDVDLLLHDREVWEQAERAYDDDYNNEPFWIEYTTCDFTSELKDSGFVSVEEAKIPKTAGPGYWHAWIAHNGETQG